MWILNKYTRLGALADSSLHGISFLSYWCGGYQRSQFGPDEPPRLSFEVKMLVMQGDSEETGLARWKERLKETWFMQKVSKTESKMSEGKKSEKGSPYISFCLLQLLDGRIFIDISDFLPKLHHLNRNSTKSSLPLNIAWALICCPSFLLCFQNLRRGMSSTLCGA